MDNDMAAFFDRLAPNWGSAPEGYDLREKLVSMMGIHPNSVIADVGCGRGAMFEHLLKTNPMKIIAVDVSSEMLRFAKEDHRDQRIEYVNGDFLVAPLPRLDAVVLFNSYPHFMDKDALIEKLKSVIIAGGILIIAHSMRRDKINSNHKSEGVSSLSVPLDSVEAEAAKFEDFFSSDTLFEDDEMYLLKMTRKAYDHRV